MLPGLFLYYLNRSALPTAAEVGETLLNLADRQQDPMLYLEAHFAAGAAAMWRGEFATARQHVEDSETLSPIQRPIPRGVQDPVKAYLSIASLILWMLGYPEQAVQKNQEALRQARELSHPFSLARVLIFAARIHQLRRERQAVREYAEAASALSTDHDFVLWLAGSTVYQGWVMAEEGDTAEGIAHMRQGIAAWRDTGAVLVMPWYLTSLAEVYSAAGQVDEGLQVLAEALALVETTGESFYEAEMYRLMGELHLRTDSAHQVKNVEAYIHRALVVARQQQAKSLELRAATSLARLWQSQDKRQDAYDLLAPVYGWFTEGFETADLQEAKALLSELEL